MTGKARKNLPKLLFTARIKEILFLIFGVTMASIGLKGFLLPNHFLDGGTMGVSLLLNNRTKIDLSLLILLVNFPFILLGARQISLSFSIKSSLAILLLAILIHFIQIPTVTEDKLLISIFGGFFFRGGYRTIHSWRGSH
jgi:uncharacterized membrane-anchored protein YitT (DUF2179 family)